jgi:hypothetical protein
VVENMLVESDSLDVTIVSASTVAMMNSPSAFP